MSAEPSTSHREPGRTQDRLHADREGRAQDRPGGQPGHGWTTQALSRQGAYDYLGQWARVRRT